MSAVKSKSSFEGKLTVTYWWKCESFPKGLPAYLKECLEERAEERIISALGQGIREGELLDYVNTDFPCRRTPEDGWECHGWFTIEKEKDGAK